MVFHLRKVDDNLASAVADMEFVNQAKVVDNKLVVTLDDPEVHNPEIIRLLVGLGAEVQFVGELRHSLEDVYLQLVQNG